MSCTHPNAQEVTWRNGAKHLKCPDCRKHVSRKTSEERADSESRVMRKKFGDSFYTTPQWRRLRYEVLSRDLRRCVLCHSSEGPFHIDHIKPRSKYPELAMELSNLQILCEECNLGKMADYEHDFRGEQ